MIELRLYPHTLHHDALRDLWVCGCGRTLTAEWVYRLLGPRR